MNDGLLLIQEKREGVVMRGASIGSPAYYLELAGKGIFSERKQYKALPFEKVFTETERARMNLGAHLIITGGEVLTMQEELIEFLNFLNQEYEPYVVEVETRGNMPIQDELYELIDFFNVYPYLATEEPIKRNRVNMNFLTTLTQLGGYNNFMFYFLMKDPAEWERINRDFMTIVPRPNACIMNTEKANEEMLFSLSQRELLRFMNFYPEIELFKV